MSKTGANEEFDSFSDCVKRLRTLLEIPSDDEGSQALLEGLADTCEIEPPNTRPGFAFRFARWVIRDEDLDLFGVVRDAILTLASAKFIFASLDAAGVTSLTVGLVALLRNAWRKGARITPQQARVLAVLAAAGKPLAFGDLLETLSWEDSAKWDKESLRHVLESLCKVPTLSGGIALVEAYANDSWGTTGV